MSPEERRRREEEARRRVLALTRQKGDFNAGLRAAQKQVLRQYTPPKQTFFDKVRDQFDANTEADKYRRRIRGQAENYFTSKVESGAEPSYIANNPGQRLVNQVRGFGRAFYESPKRIGEGIEQVLHGDQTFKQEEENRIRLQDIINKTQSRLNNPQLSLEQRAVQRSVLARLLRQQGKQASETAANADIAIEKTDPRKGAFAVGDVGLTIASAGAAGFAGKQFGKEAVRSGFKQAAKTAAPAFFENLGLNTAQGVTGYGATADEFTGKGALKSAGIGATLGTLADLGIGSLGALIGSREARKAINALANESDVATVKVGIRGLADLPEDSLDNYAVRIARETDPDEVAKIIREAAAEEAGIKVPTTTTPETTPVKATTDSTISDEVVRQFTKTRAPQQIQSSVKALFPDLDNQSIINVTRELADATDEQTTRQILERAQAARTAVTEGVQQATPDGQPVTPPAEQQLAQEAQTQPTAPIQGRQASNLDIEANKIKQTLDAEGGFPVDDATTAKVAGLVQEADKVPQATGTKRLFQGTENGQPTTWFTDDPAKLARHFGGRSDNATFRFVDVPEGQAIPDQNRPGYFQVSASEYVDTSAPSFLRVKRSDLPQTEPLGQTPETLARIQPENAPRAKGKIATKLEAQNRTSEQALRDVAATLGIDIGDVNTNLGLKNQAIEAVTGKKNLRGANLFRTASDTAGEKIAEKAEKAITGKGSKTVGAAEGFFAGTGRSEATKQIPRVFDGTLANVTDVMKRAKNYTEELLDSVPNSRETMDLVMRDDRYIQRVYGDAAKRISPDDLTPEFRDLYDKLTGINTVVNDINYKTGVINYEQWLKGRQGEHIGRLYNIPKGEKEVIKSNVKALFDQTAGLKRKDIEQLSDEVIALLDKDPARAITLRAEMALRNQAFMDALDAFEGRNFIQKTKPNDNFIQLNGARFGKYQGQFMERVAYEQLTGTRQFKGQMARSFNDLIESYQRSGIGTLDRLQKAFKTTLNAGTVVQNTLSNPLVFNLGAGTNPLTQLYDMAGALGQMRQGMSNGDVFLARQLGVIGGDTGRILTGSANETLANATGGGLAKRALRKAGQVYGGIDDLAKLGLWNRLRKQGLDPQKAALEVAKFTQDYNNVGRTVQLIADTPVLGKPFARFAPELVRIIKNNVTRAPHRIMAGVAALAWLNNKQSADSKETPEQRQAREEAVGQTLIPGTAWINEAMGGPSRDVSLNILNGETAINIARSVGLNFPQEPGVSADRALIEQLLPIEIPVTKDAQGNDQFDPTKVVTSMTLRPIAEQIFDRNFIGRQVSDPTNFAYDSQGNVKKYTDLPKGDQVRNRIKAFAASTLPMGYEATELYSAIKGKPGSTGKERTPTDAVLRSVGIKAEKYDQKTRQKKADTAEYFGVTKKAEDEFLTKNPDLESLYFQVHPKTINRATGKKVSDQITPEKWSRVFSDTSGRLFEFMKKQALAANKSKKQPVDPIYKLDKDKARQALEIRTRFTGDDKEAEQILRATQPWYVQFEKDERQYYKDNAEFYDKLKKSGVDLGKTTNPRAQEYYDVPYPEQPPLLQEYYKIKNSDPDAAKAYLKKFDKDTVDATFTADSRARWEYTNAKRKIEGAPPIPWEVWDNDTYGYKKDGTFSKFGYGKKGGGKRSKKPKSERQYLGKLLGDKPDATVNQIRIKTTPTRTKFKVKTPGGRGRRFKKVKLQ